MDTERWQRLETLFHDALEISPDEREAYLREVEPDVEIRADVLRLLEADADPATLDPGVADRLVGLAAGPASSESAAPSLEGREIGPYRVIRRIGEGGMGAVYLAERSDLDREVALKLVRGALAAPELVGRFLRERRVLARLDHPNIARLLDAGVTEDETPYFAMEYIEGEPITDHCRQVGASTEARLRLFRDVCAAVSFAHGSLVVHRDIKPSNVLVTGDGTVKLLDFGIAKLLGDEHDDATLTRTGARIMSPAYAAPEQARGEPVTTATDVYALGILLRELLTGHREPTGGGPSLSGDLEAICLKAAAPEPERRYTSADQLDADIRRHLEGLPVEARLPTLRYRAGKFLRRHAAAVAIAAVIVASLGGGLGVAVWQAQRAERAREDAETALARSETVTSFLTDLFRAADPRESGGEEVTAVELVERGVERIDELADDPPLQARLLQTLASVDMELGRFAEAESLMNRAVALRRSMPPGEELISALNLWGWSIDRLGLPDSSAAAWEEALERGIELLGEDHPYTGMAMDNLGMMLREAGRYDEAEPLLRRGMAIRREILGPDHRFFGESLFALGTLLALRGGPGDFTEADSMLHRGLQIYETTLGPEHPGTAYLLHSLGILARQRGDLETAEERFRQALAIRRGSSRDSPMVTVQTMTALAGVLRRRGQLDDALALAREASALAEERLAADHPDRGAAEAELGLALASAGDPDGGAERFVAGVGTVAGTIGAGHPRTRRYCDAAAAVGIPDVESMAACAP